MKPRTAGQRIRAMREAEGVSQTELADRLAIRQAYVSDLERGARNASLELLWAIAQALEGDPHELDSRLCPWGK